MPMRAIALFALLLAGCATCREYPTACKAVAAAVVVGTVIALDHRRADRAPPFAATCQEYYEQRFGATPAEAAHDCR
jgi:hypothetical protein